MNLSLNETSLGQILNFIFKNFFKFAVYIFRVTSEPVSVN